MRRFPLNFPVRAGFSVSGDAKNWENSGSCARERTGYRNSIAASAKIILLISTIL
jgi:hypothetical protein